MDATISSRTQRVSRSVAARTVVATLPSRTRSAPRPDPLVSQRNANGDHSNSSGRSHPTAATASCGTGSPRPIMAS